MRTALAVSILLFAGSLALPSFCQANGQCGVGWAVLVTGWLGLPTVPTSITNLAWAANPMLVLSWGLAHERSRRPSLMLSVTALFLAMLPLATREVATDESGFPRSITGFAAGYFLWLVSIAAGAIVSWLTPNREEEPA